MREKPERPERQIQALYWCRTWIPGGENRKGYKNNFFFKKAEKNSEEKQESIEQKVMECQGETLKKDLSLGIYLLEFQK